MKSIDKRNERETKSRQEPAPKIAFEMDLVALRKARSQTQQAVAQNAYLTQPKVSAFERRTSHNIQALRRYISALGGTLEIVAVFDGEQRVRLKNV